MTEIGTIIVAAGRKAREFAADQSGATAIEYGIIAAGVGAFIASTIWSMGSTLKTTFYDKLAALFP